MKTKNEVIKEMEQNRVGNYTTYPHASFVSNKTIIKN